MVNTEAVDVVVSCMIVDNLVEMQLDPLWLEGVAGCGSGVTSTVEFGSWWTSRSLVVPRLEGSFATEASLWTE